MKKVLLTVVLVMVVLIAGLIFFASSVVTNAINTVGPAVLGVPVSVEKVRAYPLRGKITINGLVIGNPEGFKTESLFNMSELHVDLSPASMFTDTIVIREIRVDAPEITYELTLGGSNIGALQKALAGEPAPEEPAPAEEPASAEPAGRKVIIERFVLADGGVTLSLPGMLGAGVPLPLPTVELKDIGKEQEGAGAAEVISKIFAAIFASVTDVVNASGNLIGDGAKAVGEGATAVGGAVADGAAVVGDTALEAGKAVGEGVSKAVGGVLNVLGGSKDEGESK